ncbi:hypothetical protein HAX54_034080, partial [Datura stramonium]|nr:hypothetical protein [Datura stramonium]
EEVETHVHLFVECLWFKEVLGHLARWLEMCLPSLNVKECVRWIRRRQWRRGKKEIVAAVWSVAIYHTWRARNGRIFSEKEVNTQLCCWADQTGNQNKIGWYWEHKES